MAELSYVTCAHCRFEVQLPANFCDMCGSSLDPGAPAIHEVLTHPTNDRAPSNGHGDPRADLLSVGADLSPNEVGMSVPQEALRKAYLLLEAVDRDLEGFRSNMLEMMQLIDQSLAQGQVGAALRADLVSDYAIPRQSETLRRNLDLVLREIETVRRMDGDAVLPVEGRKVNVKSLTGMVDRAWGDLSLSAGRAHDAITRYQRSIGQSELPEALFALGIACECADQPGRALQAFDRCGKIAPETEMGSVARMRARWLRSKMILSGWFVGSWTVLLIPVGLASAGLLGAFLDARLMLVAAPCAIFAGLYWRSKRRK